MQQREEIIVGNKTTNLYRYLHEVRTDDGMNLIMGHKVPANTKPHGTAMLVHGLGQNRYTWHMSMLSFENYLVDNGFETFNVELRGHGLSRANEADYPDHFDTYIEHDMPALFKAISEITHGKKTFMIGHSLGGAISYCVGAKFQDYLAGIVSIAGPYNMAKGNALLQTIAKTGVTVDSLLHISKLLPKAFYIDYIGMVTKPLLNVLDHPYYNVPLQVWYPGSMESEAFRERVEKGFDRTSSNVVRFMFRWGAGGKLSTKRENYESEIANYRNPILFVVGDKDYAVPLDAVQQAYDMVGSTDKILKIFGEEVPGLHFGHIDLIFGRHAPDIVWPYILEWMQRH